MRVCLNMSVDGVARWSVVPSLLWAALVTRISLECHRKQLMSWTVNETLFNLKSSVGVHLKMDHSSISPNNQVSCKDAVC